METTKALVAAFNHDLDEAGVVDHLRWLAGHPPEEKPLFKTVEKLWARYVTAPLPLEDELEVERMIKDREREGESEKKKEKRVIELCSEDDSFSSVGSTDDEALDWWEEMISSLGEIGQNRPINL